eukprot:CAMPEP_0174257094 /NCGR_PEP_ID=MMETSP0439-20130205/6253_1 /TAXON_ID=0 /ORGANISM="Stereomyxa ramosa, Strain Chinc5" /LENGTH=473 /DNA_ID=CAMNT_0015340011 /DNA_START=117 /DNA_END=1538 /DNA_ORIENTATION=+
MEREFQTCLTPQFLCDILKDREHFQEKTITRAELRHVGEGEDLQGGSYILLASVFYHHNSATNKDEQELRVFIKVLNSTHAHLEGTLSVFAKECNMYSEIIPKLSRFNKLKGSGVDLGDFLPKFFWAGDCGDDKIVVLEDLRVQGFDSSVRKEFHSFPKTKIVLESIAKFHATAYVMKKVALKGEGEDEEIQQSVKGFEDAIGNFPYLLDSWSTEKGIKFLMPVYGSSFKNTVRLLEVVELIFQSGKYSDKLKLEKTFHRPDAMDKLKKIEETQSLYLHIINNLLPPIEPFSVVSHGDLHMYNIWFKEPEDNSGCLETKLFDFQMSRYGSPLLDFQQYLIQSTTPEFRKKHLHDCLSAYSASFTSTCQLLGLPQEEIYFDDMKNVEEEFKRTYPYGFLFPLYFVINRYTSQQEMSEIFEGGNEEESEEERKEREVEGVLKLIENSGDGIWTGFNILYDLVEESDAYDTLDLLA